MIMTNGQPRTFPFDVDKLRKEFMHLFGTIPMIYRAPGRVNLIGEHTDYNFGFVMPASIAFETRTAIAKRNDRRLRVNSVALGETREFDLDDPMLAPLDDWTDYVVGVAVMLERAGYPLSGADLLISSTVPLGSGLSSSAALEVSIGYALMALTGRAIDKVELAGICQQAENDYVGMRCGIMDQFISANGIHDHALMIDCRSLSRRCVPIDPQARIVVADSMLSHAHAGGEYNQRRQSCEEGVRVLKTRYDGIATLRDVTTEVLADSKALLSKETYRRCRHVVTENDRVLKAADALENGDPVGFGVLMNQSHLSMRDDFEISCPEIDVLVAFAQAQPGVYGSRLTGGGFGGCTVSLVETEMVDCFMANLRNHYKKTTGLDARIFACSPTEGAGPLAV